MRRSRLALLATSFLALLAVPLASCAVEVGVSPAEVSRGEVVAARASEDIGRARDDVATGEHLAYLDGTVLVPTVDEDAPRLDPFRFTLEGERAEGVALPDFSALAQRGYDFGHATGDFMRPSVYATTSRGDVYYFEAFEQHGRRSYGVAHARPGAAAEVFELTTYDYAFFPSHVVVRDLDDVVVGAATVKEGTFGDDFPGCPSSILHAQNGVFLAHLGPNGVTPIAFPGEGRLDTLSLDEDGALLVTTGWGDESPNPWEPNVRESWRRTANGQWALVGRVVIPAEHPAEP